MKIIDCHLHFSDIKRFKNCANNISKVNYSIEGLKKEFKNNGIICGIGMGLEESKNKAFPDKYQSNPMEINLKKEIPNWLKYCLGINPIQLKRNPLEELKKIENMLNKKNVVGIKLYPGYYPVPVTDSIYNEIYCMAKTHKIPITIHCGMTYAIKGYLHDSHPLLVNRVALKYPEVKFIIAHLGDPWVMDTAAIISNNSNVYTDLSGLIVGNKKAVLKKMNSKLFTEHIQRALDYASSYDKILYGSDWPLVQMNSYIKWIQKLVPRKYHKSIFYENAIRIYNKL